MSELITKWGEEINSNNVRTEYPRPQLRRDSYHCLNGIWNFEIKKDSGEIVREGKILVPFSPESTLSTVNHILQPDEILIYKTHFTLNDSFMIDDVILHFEAVDQECKVYLNEIYLGENIGGYAHFSFNIGPKLQRENTLKVIVKDYTEEKPHARGKQILKKPEAYGALFYTPNSGIWDTVWLESVPKTYIQDIFITPNIDEKNIEILVNTNEPCEVKINIFEGEIAVHQQILKSHSREKISIDEPKFWSPEQPFLYDVVIDCFDDRVFSYFGMRKISKERDKNGILRFYLNNKPYFFNGLLDQGYWPESLLTPPSDKALLYDIEVLKELGYNTIRKHIKVESRRFYYHCDKLGMLVWQDMPNGGGRYDMNFVTELPNTYPEFGRSVGDHIYDLFVRSDKEGRKQYYLDLERMICELYNHPSLVAWVPFNEGWGQFDAKEATKLVRSLDSTRLINEACGWFDQGGGDMYSIHNYRGNLQISPQPDRVVALTEYGGYAMNIDTHSMDEEEFGYGFYRNTEELTIAYEELIEEFIINNIPKGLSAAIYTQVSDVEGEINGLMTYDRAILKFDSNRIKAANQTIYEVFNQYTSIVDN